MLRRVVDYGMHAECIMRQLSPENRPDERCSQHSDVRERVSLETTAEALNRYADLMTGGKVLITQG